MRVAAMVWTMLGLLACGVPGPQVREETAAAGPVAAIVNGEAIALTEVEWFSRATGLVPKRALERLVAERLLAQYAEARGYGEWSSIHRALMRARVHALLVQEIEAAVPAEDVDGRRRKFDVWLEQLARQTSIVYDDAGLRTALGGALTL